MTEIHNKRRRKAVFLNRAYNDMDMQASVIVALAERGYSDIHVIGLIADGHVSEPYHHELTDFLKKNYKVRFSRITELENCPRILRLSSAVLSRIRKVRKISSVLDVALKPADLIVRTIMRSSFDSMGSWVNKVVDAISDGIVLTDEIVFQEGRSPIVDKLVEISKSRYIPIYAIKTGHHIYYVSNPAKVDTSNIKLRDVAVRFFNVSGPIDEMFERQALPSVNVVRFGNPRMNAVWVKKLSDILVDVSDRRLVRLPRVVHVSIMLSKINYGVDIDLLKKCLTKLAFMNDVELAIKPHTRGMKFDFMSIAELPGVHLVPDVPSTELIDWSDLVLFSGSSIAFHVLLKDKVAGYLAFLQEFETVFDHGNAWSILNSLSDLEELIVQMRSGCARVNSEDAGEFFAQELYGDSRDPDVAGRIAQAIVRDVSAPTG